MPIQGPQQPGFYLPGAEYLNLAPNATIALQGRRQQSIVLPSTPIAAGTTAQLNVSKIIESPFLPTSGVYIHDAWLIFLPGDATEELQIVSSGFGLTMTGATSPIPTYPLGVPVLTQLSPAGAIVAVRDQDKLITGQDVIAATISLIGSTTSNLSFTANNFIKNNDPTNPHSMQVNAEIIYSRLDGIQV